MFRKAMGFYLNMIENVIFQIILAFGNYMNGGRRKAAAGFKLESLYKVRGVDRTIPYGIYHTTPHYTTPHHTTLHHTAPHHTTLHHTTLHHTTPHHTIPYHMATHHFNLCLTYIF